MPALSARNGALDDAGFFIGKGHMATTFLLIRHGETDWNIQKRYLGSTDVPLNAAGITQARALCARLDTAGITAVYASDLDRAMTFARIVFPTATVIPHTAFREMDFGVFEGLTHDEILAQHDSIYRRWLADPLATPVPGGESFAALSRRVREAVTTIAEKYRGATIAIVTHSGPIRVLLHDNPRTEDFWGIRPDNASVHTIEVA